jgi:hypothetical protein
MVYEFERRRVTRKWRPAMVKQKNKRNNNAGENTRDVYTRRCARR